MTVESTWRFLFAARLAAIPLWRAIPLVWGSSLFEGLFPLNEPIRARLFLLAPRPKSRRHHINKGWAWFEAKRSTAL